METKTETSDLNLEKKEIGTVEIKIGEETNVNNEEIKINVTLKSRLIASLKTKLSYVYNKFMKLVSCTTTAVDTTYEPSTHEPRRHIEDLKNMKEPVIDIEQPAVVEEPRTPQPQEQVVVEQPVSSVEPVVVEEPVSIEERI
jgi:CO dehydrogenase/acetyl-CoA synthase alpha subunit